MKKLLALVGLALVATGANAAGPWYVAPTGADTNDCLVPATPCLTINGALMKPNFALGDIVRVATGTYTGTGIEVVFLGADATVSGGWDAGFTTNAGISIIDGENARRGLTVESGVAATVERFIVENGFAFSPGGAGVLNDGVTLTLDDCVIRNNDGYGGIRNIRGVLTLNRTIVSDHLSEGGIINFGGTMVLNESTVTRNGGAGIDTSAYGSGNSGSVTLHRTTVSDNAGFGIINGDGSVELKESTVKSNAGGIHNSMGMVLVNNSTVRDNAPSSNVGGIRNWSGNGRIGTVTLINSTVSGNGNAATLSGGGVFNSGALIAINSTITGNEAKGGGGIFHQYNPGFSSVFLSNSIVAGNFAAGFGGSDCETSSTAQITSLGHNLIGTLEGNCSVVLAAGDLTNVHPLLAPLQNYGGPTDTHALLPGSPAIDMGDNEVCTGPDVNSIDQRGVERPDGDAASAGNCDIGAVEFIDTDFDEMPESIVALRDLNGNGIPEVGVAVPGSTRVHIRDGSTGVLISDIDFGSDGALQMAVLPDLHASGNPQIAMLNEQRTGQVRVQIRDSVTGGIVKNLWYGKQYQPVRMSVVPDYSGNGFPEIAVLGSKAGTDAVRVQIQDSLTGTFLDNVFLGTQSIAKHLVSVNDTSGNGIAEMGILGVLKANDQVRMQMWDAQTAAFQSNVWYAKVYQPQSTTTMPDINGNGSDEIVAVGVDPVTQNIRVQVRDSDTTALLYNIWLGAVNEAVDIALINDINGNGFADLAVLLKTPGGTGRVRVQDGQNGAFIRNLFYTVVEEPVGLAVMPDYSGNGFDELAVLGESAGVRHVQILDTSTGGQVNRIDFP